MSNENSPPSTPNGSRRRASFSPGQTFSELFARAGNSGATTGTPAYPSSIGGSATGAQAQQRRRVSVTTLGLSGSPNQTSPFGRVRRGSLSSTSSGSPNLEESVIEEGEAVPPNNTPSSPFARRVSFGAQALRDVRVGSGGANGDGFNWSETLRTRAERAPSLSHPAVNSSPSQPQHQRSTSVATMEPPVKEVPKSPKVPDHFQERILKGDFYMD